MPYSFKRSSILFMLVEKEEGGDDRRIHRFEPVLAPPGGDAVHREEPKSFP